MANLLTLQTAPPASGDTPSVSDSSDSARVWEGIDGTRSMLGHWLEAWEEFEVIARDFIDGPGGRCWSRSSSVP